MLMDVQNQDRLPVHLRLNPPFRFCCTCAAPTKPMTAFGFDHAKKLAANTGKGTGTLLEVCFPNEVSLLVKETFGHGIYLR